MNRAVRHARIFTQSTELPPVWCPPSPLEQVAFADKILLNKTDLVSEEEKQHVIQRIKVGGARAGQAGT